MPRRLRLHVPGGFYHVTLRGNHQQDIFSCHGDRSLLNSIVAKALEGYSAQLHAYCWMTNHIHLLVQVGEQPLGCAIRCIASQFARRMQRRLATTGHFFERRYNAKLIDVDSYLLELLRYIHQNPVKAGLVNQPAAYPWSSHHNYVGSRDEAWVTTDYCLAMFARDRARAIGAYQAFVSGGNPAADELIEAATAEVGSASFKKALARQGAVPAQRTDVESLIAEACKRFEVAPGRLLSPSRDRYLAQVRAWVAAEAVKRGVATLSAVARILRRDESTLRQLIRSHAKEIA